MNSSLFLIIVSCILVVVTVVNFYLMVYHVSSAPISDCVDSVYLNFIDRQKEEDGGGKPRIRSTISKKTAINQSKEAPKNMDKKTTKAVDLVASDTHINNSTGFVRHDKVAIVTKIHGKHQWSLLEQSLCLLHFAYNHKLLYDIIVFSTDPVPEENIESLRAMLASTKVSLVVDNKGLQNEIADLPTEKHEFLKKLCNVTDTSTLNWFSVCENNRLAYNWQAEFRGKRLWHHPALAEYKTMFWMDTDGFATKPWENDPIDYFIRNEGVIMFDHFPQAHSKFYVQQGIFDGFGATLCEIKLDKTTGNLLPKYGAENKCRERGVPNIHGFFHITNLDFYRSPAVTKGLDSIFGDCFLCRQPDDQLAVTAPAAMLAPERSWEMRSKGFHLDVFHNSMMDGIDTAKPGGFIKYWDQKGQYTLPAAVGVCKVENAK